MSDDPQNDLKPEIRQLPRAMNLFLRRAMPRFTVETCAEAFILTLAKLIPTGHMLGLLMGTCPSDKSSSSIDAQRRTSPARAEKQLPRRRLVQRETSAESQDDLKLVLHPSLKTLQFDPAERQALEDEGCRAAVEIHFAYYSRPILRVILGIIQRQVAAHPSRPRTSCWCFADAVSSH